MSGTPGVKKSTKTGCVSWKCLDKPSEIRPRGKTLDIEKLHSEPVRSILVQASAVLNIRGKQFHNLVDVHLSDEEVEPVLSRRLNGPPTSLVLKRAYGIEEARKSGQDVMDFFDDRWVEFCAPSETTESVPQKNKRQTLNPVIRTSMEDLRRPWKMFVCEESYDPLDPARPPGERETCAPYGLDRESIPRR
ncbi:hypothetical protein RvY_07818-2 [Ramazzottius varieornatus]|uniref:Uncharacterized protein n=1 Tax=Ramazzottius varieornatus TaxID=947166 RepID=A0A1D1V664_RAMVA|nr:hypothetical protein RvY_07818-2 [Ramazzottius varieornatus]